MYVLIPHHLTHLAELVPVTHNSSAVFKFAINNNSSPTYLSLPNLLSPLRNFTRHFVPFTEAAFLFTALPWTRVGNVSLSKS